MTILTMAIADAIAIAALCTLYMVRHRNRELMISYAVINAGIFTVSVALVSAGSNASSKSSSSLAKTGASDAMTAAGLGMIALGAGGATIVATRMRKKA